MGLENYKYYILAIGYADDDEMENSYFDKFNKAIVEKEKVKS